MVRIKSAIDYLRQNLNQSISVSELSERVGLNQNLLQKGFRAVNGMTVKEFEMKLRLDEAYRLIMETDLSISEITYKIGINSKSYFSKLFKQRFGDTPSGYRDKFSRQTGSN